MRIRSVFTFLLGLSGVIALAVLTAQEEEKQIEAVQEVEGEKPEEVEEEAEEQEEKSPEVVIKEKEEEKPAVEEKPAEPAKPEELKEEEAEEPEEEPVQLPGTEPAMPDQLLSEEKVGFRGNWVKKRQWLTRAMNENNRLQQLVLATSEARMPYMQAYFELDKELDLFYKWVGASKEQLQSLGEALHEQLEERKAQVGEDDAELQKLAVAAKDISAYEEEASKLDEFEEALKKRLNQLDTQFQEAMKLSAQARALYEEIWDIIDDKLAEANFYKIQGEIGPKVENIHQFITGTLNKDFADVIEGTRTHIASLRERIEKLESSDFAVKMRTTQQAREKAVPAPDLAGEPAAVEQGAIVRFFSWVWELITTPFRWIFGS